MSVKFSGWEVKDDRASFPGVELEASQTPRNKGVYIMYHGTTVANARLIIAGGFTPSSKGMLGMGVYVSRSIKKARNYPHGSRREDRVILEVSVRVGRVKRIDRDDHPLQATWNSRGYDTAWVPANCGMASVPSGMEEDCVFDPARVTVKGVAKAPSVSVAEELGQLLDTAARNAGGGGGGGGTPLCPLCRRTTQQGSSHITQKCWECGKDICILMSKHYCPGREARSSP